MKIYLLPDPSPSDLLVVGLYAFTLDAIFVCHRSEFALVSVQSERFPSLNVRVASIDNHIIPGSDTYFTDYMMSNRPYHSLTYFTPGGIPFATNNIMMQIEARRINRMGSLIAFGMNVHCSKSVKFQQLESIWKVGLHQRIDLVDHAWINEPYGVTDLIQEMQETDLLHPIAGNE